MSVLRSSLSPDMDDLLRRHIIFNDKAEHFAKMGAKLHPRPSEETDISWQSHLADLKSFAKLILAVWALWPKLTKVDARPGHSNAGLPRRRRPRGNSNPGATHHCWSFG
eukprot:5535505-Heterocapsa_arctica.AAC.1